MVEKLEDKKYVILQCVKCGEYLHVQKIVEYFDEQGKKHQKTSRVLVCPACGHFYK